MTQQERLKKLFEENALPITSDNGSDLQIMTETTFIRVASELLEEREQKTDLEKFVALYKSFGIECKVNKVDVPHQYSHMKAGDQYIVLTDGREGKNETGDSRFNGYGMYTDIVFDSEGKFRSQGFWE